MPNNTEDWSKYEVKTAAEPQAEDWSQYEVKKKEEPVSVGVSESLDIPVVSTQEEVVSKEPQTYIQKELRDRGLLDNTKQPITTGELQSDKTGSETLKALKSSSARALGGILGLPAFIEDQIGSFVIKPIMKGLGYTEEEAQRHVDVMKQTPIMGTVLTPQISAGGQQQVNKYASSIESTMKQYDEGVIGSIQEGVKTGDLSKFSDAGAQLWRGAVQSVPYLAMTAATAGGGTPAVLATIGTTAAAQRYGDLQDPQSPEGKKLSETGKFLNSWAYGGMEAAGELVTAGLLNTARKAVGQIGEEAVQEIGKGFTKQILKDFALEGSSEGATELGQQVTDYLSGLRDNIDLKAVGDATLIGGVSGGGIGGVTATANKAAQVVAGRKVASDSDVETVNKNNAQIVDLMAEKEKAPTEDVASVIDSQIKTVVDENNKIITDNIDTATKLTPEEIIKVNDISDAIDSYDFRIENPTTEDNVELLTKIKDKLVEEKQTLVDEAKKRPTAEIKPTDTISEPVKATKAEEAPIAPREQKEGLKQTKQDAVGGVVEQKKEPSTKLGQKENVVNAISGILQTDEKKLSDIASKIGIFWHGSDKNIKGEPTVNRVEKNIKTKVGGIVFKDLWDAFYVTKDRDWARFFSPKKNKIYGVSLAKSARILDASNIVESTHLKNEPILGRNLPNEDFSFQKEFDAYAFDWLNKKRESNGKNPLTKQEFLDKDLENSFRPSHRNWFLDGLGSEAFSEFAKEKYDAVKFGREIAVLNPKVANFIDEKILPNKIYDEYQKAKQDGSNPELVNVVEQLIQKQQPIVVEPQITEVSQTKTEQNGKETSDETQGGQKGRQEVLTEKEEAKVAESTGVKPKNLRDVYRAGREIFGLNKAQALAQAIIVDRVIAKAAKNSGKTKQQIYSEIEFRKEDDLLRSKVNTYFQAAWHGSPYQFDKFTTEKIGTGEGAQAFGWGLYFTDLKSIAEGYARTLGNKKVVVKTDGKIVDLMSDAMSHIEEIAYAQLEGSGFDVKKAIEKLKYNQSIRPTSENPKAIEILKITTVEGTKNLYRVELHKGKTTEQYDWLVWDKEVTSQQKNKISDFIVKALLNPKNLRGDIHRIKISNRFDADTYDGVVKVGDTSKIGEKDEFIKTFDNMADAEKYAMELNVKDTKLDGRELYEALASEYGQKEASLILLEAGIDGIKYPAESIARGATSETARGFNYVVFDENAVTIEEVIKFQKQLQGKRGAMAIHDGKSLVYALTDPNVSTPLHEIAHVYERYMLPSEKAAVLAWTGHKTWSVETSEKFARGFERYLAEGVAPTEKLKAVFERFKTWLTDIYNGIKQSEIDVELNIEMKRLYDSILTGKKYTPSKEKVATNAQEVPKKTYKDVDDLLFQSGDVKFQDTDKTERHTKALENLISHLESEKSKDVAKEVNDYLKAKGNPISQELIDKVLKERGYAKGTRTTTEETGQQAQGMVEGKKREIPVGDNGKDKKTPRGKDEKVTGETKQRGTQTSTLTKAGGIWERLAKEAPLFYEVRKESEAIANAVKWLSKREESAIQNALEGRKSGTPWERMDRRMIYMMYLKEKMSSFIEQGKTEEANAVWENIKKIEEAVAKEGTEAGWMVQALAKFKRLDDISTTFVINNEIAKHNQSLYPETDIKKVSESEEDINKLSKEIVNEAVDDEKLTNVVNTIAEKNKGKKRTETYSEKAKEIADKLRKVKSSNWGITLAADPISSIGIGVLDGAVETTAKAIELSGNIADSINKGINQIKRSDWYKGLNAKQKRHLERAFELNVKKDLGVDALDRATLEKYLKREMKDLGVSLKYIIKEHWANPTAFGTKLSDRIVANLGLTEAEAKLVEKTVNDIIRQKLEDKITNSILNESLPKSKAQKEIFLNKMGEFLMMGNIEHKYFREAFADKFGLTPDITAEQADYLTKLNKAVDATKDMGVYGDIVANQLAQEIDKLIPRTKIQELLSTMVGLDYVNVLSGYTTSYINIKSVFWNLLTRPIMDVTDGAEWIKSIKNGKPTSMPILNAFNSWVDFFSMSGKSYTGLIDVLKSGDLRAMHKYISEVKSVAHLKVPEMERQKYGKDRFKPITVSVNGKNIDVNTTNYVKFVGRALAAQDIYSNIGFDAVELANALRKKMRAQGFTESQIKEQIQRQVYGWNLTEKEQKEVDDQLAKEKEGLKRFGFTTDKYKDNRRRLEIIREKLLDLEEQDILDLKEVAKGNVFNDARGGIANAVMSSLSRFANKNVWTKLGLMPHFMFFTITGNIGDFMIDTIPAYGSLRARGVTPTTIAAHYSKYRADGMSVVDATRKAIFGARLSTLELPFKTAMLGDKGSYRREQQLARARLGNVIMLSNFAIVAGLYAIGGGDKDENGEYWFDISGGRWDVKDVTTREQQLMPPYTIKIGKYKFRYGNAPILTFGMSMVGNYRDMINAGASDEEARQRMKLMSRSYAYSIASLTDQQLMQGFKSITQSGAELWKTGVDIKKEDETGESQAAQKIAEKFGKYIVKEQLSPFTGWLPTKNNAFQQSMQFISKKAVESKDIPSMLAYDLGIHQFTNRTALDRFGDDVKRKPGYTGIYWEPEMITSDPKKWDMVRWLQTNNAFPASYYNRDERFVYDTPKSKGWLHDLMGDKKPVVESKAPTEDQFYEMRKLEGNMLKKDLMRYKDATYEGKPIWEREAKEQLSSGETVMQQKVKKYISEAKQQTKLYLFTWADIGKKDPALFKQLYESKSLPQYETKVPVFKRNLDGGIYKDENGEYVVKIKQDLVSDQLALFNAEAFRYYMKLMKEARTTDTQKLKQLSDVMWKVAVQTKAAEYKGE